MNSTKQNVIKRCVTALFGTEIFGAKFPIYKSSSGVGSGTNLKKKTQLKGIDYFFTRLKKSVAKEHLDTAIYYEKNPIITSDEPA